MAEGTLIRWMKKVGEEVNKGEVLAEIETDKATVEVESTAGGVVRLLLVDEGAIVPVSTPIAVVGTADEEIKASAAPEGKTRAEKKAAPAPAPESEAPGSRLAPAMTTGLQRASPLAKRMAREERMDLAQVTGSGPGGRIVRRDIEAALAGGAADQAPAAAPIIPPVSVESRTVPMSRLRQAIGRRMVEAKNSVPHFYVTFEYDVGLLLTLREQFNAILPDGEKASVNDFIVKAVALTLRQYPNLNASLRGDAIIQHGQVNIGVAVAVEGGLLTVVCKDVDRKPLRQIASEVRVMAGRARSGKVRPDDIEGSTFSVSNLGMYGVEDFFAIINPPEAAILAVGAARQVPVVEAGAVKPGWRMKASISVDHRVSDGAEAAQFMQALAKYLEEPLRLLL